MKTTRQFALITALILALVAPLAVPVMACALPHAHLSRAERACCRHMDTQCASSAAPKCESCCRKELPTAQNWNAAVQARSTSVQLNLNAANGLFSVPFALQPVNPFDHSQWSGITLPQSPPSAISVLRI
jgi:hypothetical protein